MTQSNPLTDEQVENWRRVLMTTLGPFAMMMTKEQIQAYRDRIQNNIDTQYPNNKEETSHEHC